MRHTPFRRKIAAIGLAAALFAAGAATATLNSVSADTTPVYGCFDAQGVQTTRPLQETTPVCATGAHWVDVTTGEKQPPPTTTTQPATTTTQPAAGAFMSFPLQPCTTSASGTNVIISNRSYRGCRGVSAIVVSNATNVYIHDIDFDSNSGDIFLINVGGNIRIENIRARNTGAGRTTNGSGQGEVIQFNNSWQGSPSSVTTAGIRNIKIYGGNTEDSISIYKSGGLDASHPLIIEDIHEEHPLPPDPLAWSSGSGTCLNTADDDIAGNPPGGHDIIVQNSTFLNCGQAGMQSNRPLRVTYRNNIIYGAARASSNVGLTQWASSNCSACLNNFYTNNRVWWVKSSGSASDIWLSNTAQVTLSGNVAHDGSINPASLHVVL